ncbi:hypothetical protein AAFG13_36095 [Bradyrhizobium sp. B124]|uniref:hypothetical protein n=1 Tax=Bradyrhizobium sp. B124 TaxID=3140245 RepID=UPI00318417ED
MSHREQVFGEIVGRRDDAHFLRSLPKHTETQEADTKAVGLGDAALASFRATAAETSAVQGNNGKETAAQAAKFAELRDRAAAAADALARAKVSPQIDFSSRTAFTTRSSSGSRRSTSRRGLSPMSATIWPLGSRRARRGTPARR